MREKPTRAEKEPKKIYYKTNRELISELKTEGEPQPPTLEVEHESTLQLAALLKKWKKKRKMFWMKVLMYCFFVAYVLVSGFPVYLAWAENWVFREGWSLGGKLFLTTAMSIMAVSAIVSGWGSHKKWVERQ